MSKHAKLRACASCEWIFRNGVECPKCGFVSYGARCVYGDKCYTYEHNQKPWLEKKVLAYEIELLGEIIDANKTRNKFKKALMVPYRLL